jgi:lipopolysaccharide/colanic/teichoic acid biosynthesis glycosyltransferase
VPAVPNTLYARVIKRQIDIVVASFAILITLPLMVLVAITVRIALGSPVLFHDERAGLGGRPIRVTKFRSMSDARDDDGNLLPDDVRLSAFGKFLRRTSLDELPQLASVLFGDMSLIGPRPLPLRYVPRYNSRQATRLLVRPGLTGLAQVNGRNAINWGDRLEFDVRYVEMLGRPAGLVADFWIACLTACQIVAQSITGRGIAAPGATTMQEFAP